MSSKEIMLNIAVKSLKKKIFISWLMQVSPKAVFQEHTWWALAVHGNLGPGAALRYPLTCTRCGHRLLSILFITGAVPCCFPMHSRACMAVCAGSLTCCSLCLIPAQRWAAEVLLTHGLYCSSAFVMVSLQIKQQGKGVEWNLPLIYETQEP